MSVKGFITVTEMDIDYDGVATLHPGFRMQVSHIIGYMPFREYRKKAQKGSKVFMAAYESYAVQETVDQLDSLIQEATEG